MFRGPREILVGPMPKSRESSPHKLARAFEVSAGRMLIVRIDRELISFKSWNYVKVDVWNILECGLAVREPKVNSVTAQGARSKCGGSLLPH